MALTVFSLIDFIENIGKKIPFLELITLYLFLSCIAMPVVAYEIFNKHNDLAKLWVTYMPVPSREYFSYALPSCLAFLWGTKTSIIKHTPNIQNQIDNIKNYLKSKSKVGFYLIGIGIVSDIFVSFSPILIKNIVQNFAYLTYIGMFYVIYSPSKNKILAIVICLALTIGQSISTGMYGELVYLSAMSTLIILGGKKINFYTKLIIFIFGLSFLFLIQSIKSEYRDKTWSSNFEKKADPVYFINLVYERLQNPSTIFEPKRLFNASVRANQGQIIARVLNYVPKHEPFAYGETIGVSVLSAFVPRFLWPDKPKTGGADNVCRFLGDCESFRNGFSYNISPVGEAYVNFGKTGGVIFMFFYGFFYSFIFNKAHYFSKNNPTIILWFPLIFFSFFTMENDVLSFINAFAKSSFFCWLVYKTSKLLFKTNI
ncbi:MAG: hypothetical protein J0L99_01690 [Chitinophagales bacterium]|nr:hypothetical protein [Chitinophagales bacterium]